MVKTISEWWKKETQEWEKETEEGKKAERNQGENSNKKGLAQNLIFISVH